MLALRAEEQGVSEMLLQPIGQLAAALANLVTPFIYGAPLIVQWPACTVTIYITRQKDLGVGVVSAYMTPSCMSTIETPSTKYR